MEEPKLGTSADVEEGAAQPQAASGQGMGALLQEHESDHRSLRRGDVVDGIVVRIDRDEVLVDIGAKSEAIVPAHEVRQQELATLRVGTPVVAYVLQSEDQEGRAVLSLTRAEAERNWRALARHFEAGDILTGKVVEANKGGLVVSVMGVRGFVPLSQVAELRRGEDTEASIEERLRSHVGREIQVKIIEMNRRRNRLIMSERAAAQIRRAQQKERLLEELKPGEIRHGVISSICDFGAFVDLGGADGLIHLSELSWRQVAHPRDAVRVGQEVDVQVLAVDREKKKIALSLKRLQAEPWSRVAETYRVGDMVDGRITKLAAFGAFAEIEEGVEGLIHISELSDARITHPRQVVREGDRVQVRILRMEPARRRLGLSLRQGGFVYETPPEEPQAGGGVAAPEGPEAGAAHEPSAPAATDAQAEGLAAKIGTEVATPLESAGEGERTPQVTNPIPAKLEDRPVESNGAASHAEPEAQVVRNP